MSKFIFITGGQRSGKSVYAEKLALELSSHPFYIATAEGLDDEMRERIKRHQQRRGNNWTTIEEPVNVGDIRLPEGAIAVFDCMTLWATNCLFKFEEDVAAALSFMKSELEKLRPQDATFIFVSNETGAGGISDNPLVRKFTDLIGMINCHTAAISENVYLCVAGIPVKIK